MTVAYKQKPKPKYKGIPTWILAFIIIALSSTVIAAVSPASEKEYTYKDKLSAFAKGDKWIGIAKQALSKSDLPSRDVSMILDSLTEYQNKIATQINAQLEVEKKTTEKPPIKQDSTSKKTN